MKYVIGFALGALAMWLYLNRETLGFVVSHRSQLDAAGRIKNDLCDLGIPGTC